MLLRSHETVLCILRLLFISKFHGNKCSTFKHHVNEHVKSVFLGRRPRGKKPNLWNDPLHEQFFKLVIDWRIQPTFGGGLKKKNLTLDGLDMFFKH